LNEAQNYALEHARPVVTAMSYKTHEISIAYAMSYLSQTSL